jgi:hypothetical protein
MALSLTRPPVRSPVLRGQRPPVAHTRWKIAHCGCRINQSGTPRSDENPPRIIHLRVTVARVLPRPVVTWWRQVWCDDYHDVARRRVAHSRFTDRSVARTVRMPHDQLGRPTLRGDTEHAAVRAQSHDAEAGSLATCTANDAKFDQDERASSTPGSTVSIRAVADIHCE